jgi:hypothetical protein
MYITYYAKEKLGVELEIQKVSLSLLREQIIISNPKIKNGTGFNNKYLAELKDLKLHFRIRDIFTKPLHIDLLEINNPVIVFEFNNNVNNFENLQHDVKSSTAKLVQDSPQKAPKARFSIGTIIINDLVATVDLHMVDSLSIKTSQIVLNGIGLDGGKTTPEIFDIVLAKIGQDLSQKGVEELLETIYKSDKVQNLIKKHIHKFNKKLGKLLEPEAAQ